MSKDIFYSTNPLDIDDPVELFEWYASDIKETLDALYDLCLMARNLPKKKSTEFMDALDRRMIEAGDMLDVLWAELDDKVG